LFQRWETGKVFDALEWLASMGSHVPNKAEQMVRYYGYYSNVSRGKRGKLNLDEAIPCILMSEEGAKKYRKNWARLIQKIYEADPLTCPKCQGRMKIITFIENEGLSGGLLQALKTAPGDSDCWYICYLSSVSDSSKKPRSDFHIFTWDR
jgi:hypothetical protein